MVHEMEKVTSQAKKSGLHPKKVDAIINGKVSVLRKE